MLFSGGLDSTVALAMATHKFDRVVAVMFDYGQRARIELERAGEIAQWLDVELRTVEIDLSAWGGSLLFDETDAAIIRRGPYVPARNLILLSLAAGLAEAEDLDCIWLGTNASEQGFADTSPAFIRAVQQSFDEGLRRSHAGRRLRIGAPLGAIEKQMVVKAGVNLGAPLHLSWSCYGPGPEPCTVCLACEQRRQAFAAAELPDPALPTYQGSATCEPGDAQWVHLIGVLGSGSTLLSLLLGSHSDITAAGELMDLQADVEAGLLCSCGHPVATCGFWARVLSSSPDLSRSTLAATQQLPTDSDAYTRDAAVILDRVAETARTGVLIDSSKHHLRFEALRHQRPMKALHIVRDGRSFLASARRRRRSAGTYSATQAAQHWQHHHQRALELAKILGSDYLRVRYEDLCRSPRSELDRVCDWLGVDNDIDLETWGGAESHHLRGSGIRFDRSSIEENNAWRTELSGDDIETFSTVAADELATFGYLDTGLTVTSDTNRRLDQQNDITRSTT